MRFRSSREHIGALIASSVAPSSRDLNACHQDIEVFVHHIQQHAQALNPLLLQLGSAIAAAAAAVLEGSSETRDEEPAGNTLDAQKSLETFPDDAVPASDSDSIADGGSMGVASRGSKQHRNTHALTVLRRIKCKLNGKDRWPGKERELKQSVAEQVETVIKHACSLDNLAELYEGWAAWI